MKRSRIIIVIILSVSILVSSNISFGASTNIDIENQKSEVIQAARNYKLAEEIFLHDFNEKINRQELAMLMIIMLEKLSYKNIKTVAQVLQVFYEYKDKPLPLTTYVPYIYLASTAGIVESVSKNKFNPYGLVTRQMFASVLLKAVFLAKPFNKYDLKEDVKFSDDNKIYDWARSGIIFSYKNKYMDASSKNEINPRGYLTREEALEIIYKVLIKEKAINELSSEEVKRINGESALILIKGNDQKWGYADNSNKVIIKTQFDSAKNFNEGIAAICNKGKWGFIDSAGNIIVQPEYDNVHDFHNGYAAVSLGAKFGFVDNTGKIVIKPQYLSDNDFLTDLFDFKNESAFVKLGINKYRLIDKAGKALYNQQIT